MNYNKDYKLVKIYCHVCEKYGDSLQYLCQRFSNNSEPKLIDQDIMTIYLFAMHYQGIFKIKQIHRFAKDYLGDWFPDLGSYQAFNNGLNRISHVMNSFVESICSDFAPGDMADGASVLDSMPIISSPRETVFSSICGSLRVRLASCKTLEIKRERRSLSS